MNNRNKQLSFEILYQILTNLGIFGELDLEKSKTLLDKDFLISDKIQFTLEDQIINKNVFICSFDNEHTKLNIAIVDCSTGEDKEFAFITSLEGSPAYAAYFTMSGDAKICFNLTEDIWQPCSIYMQAMFLAGMEQIRELNVSSSKLVKYDSMLKKLKSFIKYYDAYQNYEVYDER